MKKITLSQYRKAIEIVRLYESQIVLLEIQTKDLSFSSFAVSIEKIKHGQISDDQMSKLQDSLDDFKVPWFDVGTDDMGYLVIGSDKMDMSPYKEQIIKAIKSIK